MRICILIFCLFLPYYSIISQNNIKTYTQFDISIPLKGNPNRENPEINTSKNNSFFIPDGLSSKFGYGFHHNKWVSLGIHFGIDWKISEKLVAIPVFANFRWSPKLVDDIRIYVQTGLGKSFAVGRGNLNGNYKKISLGIEKSDDISFYIELCEHQLKYNSIKSVHLFSIGLAITTF
jgi:hypothetical protein